MTPSKPKTAEEWIIRLNGRGAQPLSNDERRDLTEWLVADPQRFKELKMSRLLWQLGGRLPASAAAGIALPSERPSRFGSFLEEIRHGAWARPALAGAAAVALVAMVALYRGDDVAGHLKNHAQVQTAIGEISNYTLPDNTSITVGANSSVEVDFSRQTRTIHLVRGEVFLDVAHDREHPFVIAMGGHEVVVTGTQLNVNYDRAEDRVEVAVVEGSINVLRRGGGTDAPQQMAAGDVILFPAAGSPVRRNLTPEQVAAWRTRQLYFDDDRLGDVLSEMNRYAPKRMVSETANIQSLTLTGEFAAGDVDTLLFSLQKLYGVAAQDKGDHLLLTLSENR